MVTYRYLQRREKIKNVVRGGLTLDTVHCRSDNKFKELGEGERSMKNLNEVVR